MDYKLNGSYKVEAQELSVDWNGFNFLIIYGRHKNGWFIAIPNWNVCTESGGPEDEAYNATRLAQANTHDVAPVYLSRAIKEHWESVKERGENLK